MKKRISALLVCAMLFSICTVNGFALGPDGSSDTYEELPISAEQGQEILSEFSAEISYAEKVYGLSITELDRETFETLKEVAIQNLHNEDYNFPGLIDTVVLACERNRLMNDPAIISEDGITPRGTTTRIIKGFGPISGQVDATVARGSSASVATGVTFKIENGGTLVIKDFTNGLHISGEISIEYSHTYSGPVAGETLFNGRNPTDRVYFGVLWGSIVEHRYESPVTGEVKIYHEIPKESRYVVPYSVLCSLLSVVWSDNVNVTGSLYFANVNTFYKTIREDPGKFL